jgi:hypothetical protein
MAGRSYKTEAVVLRSFRLGEADRVLHVYTLARGRIGAVAKGIRKTKSRFGARLEPLSHVELMLYQGSSELQTVTGVELVRSHHEAREQQYRLGVGLLGAEAMLRLFTEQEANARVSGTDAFSRPARRPRAASARPSLDPLAPPSSSAALAVRLPTAPDELLGLRTTAKPGSGTRRSRRRRCSDCAAGARCTASPASPESKRCSRVRLRGRVTRPRNARRARRTRGHSAYEYFGTSAAHAAQRLRSVGIRPGGISQQAS